MKIALCLHGLFDSNTDVTSKGIDGYKYIKHHILDNKDVDIFIHSWNIEKQNQINDLYKPKSVKYEKQLDFKNIIVPRNLDSLLNYPRHPHSVLSHFYSIQESFKLCYEFNVNYDIVIKSRFDLGRINRTTSFEYPVQCINFIPSLNTNFLYMADWNLFDQGPADMWFYSGYENMKLFTKIYDDLLDIFYINSDFHRYAFKIQHNMGDLSNSIIFLKYWFEIKGLWNKKIALKTQYE